MKAELKIGAELDFLSPREFDEGVGALPKQIWREYAQGLKSIRIPILQGTTSAAGALTLGSTAAAPPASQPGSPTIAGPNKGYVWMVTRLTVAGLTGSDALLLYRGEPSPTRYVRTFGAAPTDHWEPGRGAFLLFPDEFICLSATGLTDNELVTVSGEVIEAPAEQLYKLIGG